jgi:hypothetical protein
VKDNADETKSLELFLARVSVTLDEIGLEVSTDKHASYTFALVEPMHPMAIRLARLSTADANVGLRGPI